MTNPQPTNTEQTIELREILAIGSKKPETDLLTESLADTLLLSTVAGSAIDVLIPVPLGPTSSAMFSAVAYSVIKQCKNTSPSDIATFRRDTQEGIASAYLRSLLDDYDRVGQTAILTSSAILAGAVPATFANIGGVIGACAGPKGFFAGYGLGAVAGYGFALIIAPACATMMTNFIENPKQRVTGLRLAELERSGLDVKKISYNIESLAKKTNLDQDGDISKLEKMYLELRSSDSEVSSELKELSLPEFTKLIKVLSIKSEELSALYKDHKQAKKEQVLRMFDKIWQLPQSENNTPETLRTTLTAHYKTYYQTDKEPSLRDLSRFMAKHTRAIDLEYNGNFLTTLKNQFVQDQNIQATREFHGKIENALLLSYLQPESSIFDKALEYIINNELRKSTTFTGVDDKKMWEAIKQYFKDNKNEEGISFCEQHEQSSQRMQIFFNQTSIAEHFKFDIIEEGPSGCCSCHDWHRMGEAEQLMVSI